MNIGIVGGGQLARMLALSGHPLNFACAVLDPAADACAGQVAELIAAAYDDPTALGALAGKADVVTFDFENVPESAAHQLAERVPVYPPPAALALAQDRLTEKRLFTELEIPTVAFAAVDSLEKLPDALASVGLPAVLKTRRLGYDGKGQQVVHSPGAAEAAFHALGGAGLIVEGFAEFEREVSILAVRGRDGEMASYPLAENTHVDGILRLSRAPHSDPDLTAQANEFATRLLRRLDYVGVLALELFDVGGRLLANEMAPRVHNSGHWTIEGAETSQFENHLRAIAGLPLGATTARGHSAMVNFIGSLPPALDLLDLRGAHYHGYGKAARPGRKVGHLTLRTDDSADLDAVLNDRLAPYTGRKSQTA